ncbi:MAG: 16S rRNA (adenine(1518)-N(6)/adenine(1519)-N(6))-dimethyltransferase RsmA [Acidimicrobiia bacterium]|nr:16S rRNA (adenine(1518)-N(6)/adenine(1519)-N(6))-dimethyltransferase RsmA [Acidimicrobiia bacterium]
MARSKLRVPVLNPCDPRALLREHGVHPSRALGQNFLADPNTARRIVRLAEVGPGSKVLEIGPGLGALTVALAEAGASVHALELDRHLIPILEAVVSGTPNVTVEQGDALTWDFAELRDENWLCVSNLPYNVATPVVARLLEEAPQMTRMLLMVQREVGERLVASPGSRIYGAVSVKVAYHATSRIVGAVPPTVFVPRPKVESALVLLERRPQPPVDVPSYDRLFALVSSGFAQRRKMLRRALVPALGERTEAVLVAAGIAPTERAEALDLESWAALARSAAE